MTSATVRAAAYAAFLTHAKLIAVFTESGRTAQLLAGERSEAPTYAFTPSQRTVQRLALVWGVTALRVSKIGSVREMMNEAEVMLRNFGVAREGEVYAVVVGTSRRPGIANILKLHTVGDEDELAARGH